MFTLPLAVIRSGIVCLTPLSALNLPTALGFGLLHGTIKSVASWIIPQHIITDLALIALAALALSFGSTYLLIPLSVKAITSFGALYFITHQCETFVLWTLPKALFNKIPSVIGSPFN